MLLRCDGRATRSTDEVDVVIRFAVFIDVRQATEVTSDADRPVQRGLVNAGSLAPGDTIYSGKKVQFKPMPQFAPEAFRILRAKSLGDYKAFRKGLDQLAAEGVVQILRNEARGDAAPVMAAVGPMQFEVMQARMEVEYNVETVTEPIPYSVARRTDAESASELGRQRGVEIFTRTDGELIALFGDKWKLAFIEKEHPELTMEPLVAD